MATIETYGHAMAHEGMILTRGSKLVGDRLGERFLTMAAGRKPGPRRVARRIGTALVGGAIVALAYIALVVTMDIARPSRAPNEPVSKPAVEEARPSASPPAQPVAPAPVQEPYRASEPAPPVSLPFEAEIPKAPETPAASPPEAAAEEIILESVQPVPAVPPLRFESREAPAPRPRAVRPRGPATERAAPRFEIPESLRPSS